MDSSTNFKIIKDRILSSEYGTVFVATDFVEIANKTSINTYLSRLVNEKLIRRILRGVYYKAEYNH